MYYIVHMAYISYIYIKLKEMNAENNKITNEERDAGILHPLLLKRTRLHPLISFRKFKESIQGKLTFGIPFNLDQ